MFLAPRVVSVVRNMVGHCHWCLSVNGAATSRSVAGAFDLIHQVQDDEQCRNVLNSIIYCSVLKGFTREKKIDRVWTIYEAMQERRAELSVVTCNILIDACARCGRCTFRPSWKTCAQCKSCVRDGDDKARSEFYSPGSIEIEALFDGVDFSGTLTRALR